MQIKEESIITSEQIRAARHALKWNFEMLAENSSISVRTLKTLETHVGIPPCRTNTLVQIQAALESAGIEFIGSPDDRPGIRINISKPDQ